MKHNPRSGFLWGRDEMEDLPPAVAATCASRASTINKRLICRTNQAKVYRSSPCFCAFDTVSQTQLKHARCLCAATRQIQQSLSSGTATSRRWRRIAASEAYQFHLGCLSGGSPAGRPVDLGKNLKIATKKGGKKKKKSNHTTVRKHKQADK